MGRPFKAVILWFYATSSCVQIGLTCSRIGFGMYMEQNAPSLHLLSLDGPMTLNMGIGSYCSMMRILGSTTQERPIYGQSSSKMRTWP